MATCSQPPFVVLQKDLDIAADALDANVQAEHGLERDCENEQRQEGGDGQCGERSPSRSSTPAQPIMPARNTQIRAVPRSRIVRAGARNSSSSRGVIDSCFRGFVGRYSELQDRDRVIFTHGWRHYCLVLMRLSARMPRTVTNRTNFLDWGAGPRQPPLRDQCACRGGCRRKRRRREADPGSPAYIRPTGR